MPKNQLPTNSQAGKTTISAPAKNFGLRPEEFDNLVAQLKVGDETLFQTIFLAHFEDCMKYLTNKFGIQQSIAYDMTMDALILFRRKLLEGKIGYGNIRFLFTQMACQLYLKSINKKATHTDISEAGDLIEQEQDDLFDDESLGLLDQAWDQLCEDCRGLLKRFYYHKATLKEIAEEQQKTAAALRKQKQRCVEKLRKHFNELDLI
jgi:RNA polymerase sigma factor (sigma-70 family)